MKVLCRPISASDWVPDRFCVISMEFLSLSRRRSSSRKRPPAAMSEENVCHSQAIWKVDSVIHWINHYPLDSAIGFPNTYPMDSTMHLLNNGAQEFKSCRSDWSKFWQVKPCVNLIYSFILLHEKFLQFDWLRAVVFQLNLKYLHVKITTLLRVVV